MVFFELGVVVCDKGENKVCCLGEVCLEIEKKEEN